MTPSRLAPWAAVVLAVVAEAAWIEVVGAFVADLTIREPVLTLPALAPCVGLGIVLARVVAPRAGLRWPIAGLALAVGVGLVAAIAAARLAGGPDAGWADAAAGVAGLAVLRGYAHAGRTPEPSSLEGLLALGTAVITVLALFGNLIPTVTRDAFLSGTTADGLVFAAAAVLAITAARMAQGADAAGWATSRTTAVAAAVVLVAILAGAAAAWRSVGPAVELAAGLLLGPLVVGGMLFGWSRRTLRLLASVLLTIASLAAGLAILMVISRLFGGTVQPPTPGGQPAPLPDTGPGSAGAALGTGVIALAVAVAVILVLALIRSWIRSPAPDGAAVLDTSTIDRGRPPAGPGRRPRRFRPAPRDAVAAYLALLEDIAGRPGVARRAEETPAAHARRVRDIGGGLSLDLLAADVGLVRFGDRRLTPAEDRRAVGRWRRLRTSLRAVAAGSVPQAGPAPRDRTGIEALDEDELPPVGRAPDDREA